MRSDNRTAPAPFKTTGHWQRAVIEIQRWLDIEGFDVVEDQGYNNYYSSFPPSLTAYYPYAVCCLYQVVKAKDTLGVLPRLQSLLPAKSPRRIMLDGRPLSWDALISAYSILNIAAIHPEIVTEPWIVAEIGAGWGRIACALKQMNPQATYIIFDIPETLIVAASYLPKILKAEYHYYGEQRAWLRDGCISFCGAHEMARLPDKSVDCILSTSSFQEMPHDYVDRYFDIIDRTAKTFYTLQHEHVTNYGAESYGNYFPFRATWTQRLKQEVAWSPEYFEAVFDL